MLRELACRSSLKLATCVGAPIGDVGACGRMLKRTRGGSLPSSCGEKAAKRARTAQGKAPPSPHTAPVSLCCCRAGGCSRGDPPAGPAMRDARQGGSVCSGTPSSKVPGVPERGEGPTPAAGRRARRTKERRTCMTCPEGHSTASPGSVVQLQGVARASETLPPPPTPPVGRTDHASAQPAARHATNASAEAEQPRRPRPPSMARAAR